MRKDLFQIYRKFFLLILFSVVFGSLFLACSNVAGLSFLPLANNEPDMFSPRHITATSGTYDNKVHLTWDSVDGALYYKVFRCTKPDGTFVKVAGSGEVKNVYFDDTTAEQGIIYYYRIKAYGSDGMESGYSQNGEGFAILSSVENIVPSVGSFTDRVRLTWDVVANAVYYKVYRSTTEDGTFKQVGVDTFINSFDDLSVVQQVTYFYKVRAFVAAKVFSNYSSVYSGSARLGPGNPTSVTGTEGDNGKVTITWHASSPSATYYQVFRCSTIDGDFGNSEDPEDHSATDEANSISGHLTGTTYIDTTVTDSTLYFYKVKAYNGTDSFSNPSIATYGYSGTAPAPGVPQNVAIGNGRFISKIVITWDAVPIAKSYQVYRSDTVDGTYTAVGDKVTTEAFTDTSIVAGNIYYYKVKAFNVDNLEGGLSDSVEAQTLGLPGGLVATDGVYSGEYIDYVRVAWDKVEGAHHYKLYKMVSHFGSENGVYVQVGGDLYKNLYNDGDVEVGDYYFYKVSAFDADGEETPTSASDRGIRGVSNRDFFKEEDKTILRSHDKLHNLGGTSDETEPGDVSGSVYYHVSIGTTVSIPIKYTNYCDYYLTINGTHTTRVSMTSQDGWLTETLYVSGIYNGYVRYNVKICGGDPCGGEYYVKQNGGTETEMSWASLNK